MPPLPARRPTQSSSDSRGPFGFGAGHAFIGVGIAAILIATIRFVHTGKLLDDQAMHSPGILPDLAFGVTLALLLVGLSAYLVFV
jgi:hypothetical protein